MTGTKIILTFRKFSEGTVTELTQTQDSCGHLTKPEAFTRNFTKAPPTWNINEITLETHSSK